MRCNRETKNNDNMNCPLCKSKNIDLDPDTNMAACMECDAEQDARGTWRNKAYFERLIGPLDK